MGQGEKREKGKGERDNTKKVITVSGIGGRGARRGVL